MLNKFFNKKKDNKGFTLVELVIVVAILAILVGLLAPQYTKYVERSRKSADASNLENMVRAVEIASADPDTAKNIPARTYTITIGATGTTVTPEDKNTEVEAAIAEYVDGNWKATKLKSAKWKNSAIKAIIEIKADGATSVTYAGDDFEEYIGKKVTTED